MSTAASLSPHNFRLADVEQRYKALDRRIADKRVRLETRSEALGAATDALEVRVRELREDLARKKEQLRFDLARATPETTVGSRGHDLWTGASGFGLVTIGGGPKPERHEEITRLTEELGRFTEQYAATAGRRSIACSVFSRVREYLDKAAVGTVVPIVVKYTRLADPRGELAAIRERLAALEDEVLMIEVAPVPMAEAMARLDERARRIADRLAAYRSSAVPAFFNPRTSDVSNVWLAPGGGRSTREVEDAIAKIGDELFLASLPEWRKAIKAHHVNGAAIATADRPRRLVAIAAERITLERNEERAILSAEADGLELDRRNDASGEIVATTIMEAV
jgi:hypothetical protein